MYGSIQTATNEYEAEISRGREITISVNEYRELITKAACFDLITTDIRKNIEEGFTYDQVDVKLIKTLTGTKWYTPKQKGLDDKSGGESKDE